MGLRETIQNLEDINVRIDKGLRGSARKKAASAYGYFKGHPFGDCFSAMGEICLSCKKFNHPYSECAKVSGSDDVCGPCKIKAHDFAACFPYMKTLCHKCQASPHPRNVCAAYLKAPC